MVDVKELNEIKDTLLSKMKELFKKDGKIDSMGIIVDKDGTVAFVPMPYRDNQEKLTDYYESKYFKRPMDWFWKQYPNNKKITLNL